MTSTAIGISGIVALFALIALHVPLAFAMIAVGIVAFALQTSWGPALTFLASEPSQVLGSIDLAAVPMFLTVTVSGVSVFASHGSTPTTSLPTTRSGAAAALGFALFVGLGTSDGATVGRTELGSSVGRTSGAGVAIRITLGTTDGAGDG